MAASRAGEACATAVGATAAVARLKVSAAAPPMARAILRRMGCTFRDGKTTPSTECASAWRNWSRLIWVFVRFLSRTAPFGPVRWSGVGAGKRLRAGKGPREGVEHRTVALEPHASLAAAEHDA